MSLTAWPFAVFVLATLAAFSLSGRRGQLAILLVASLVFHATWSWHAPLLLLAATAANHALARRLWDRPSRAGLVLGIAINVGLLLALKYVAPSWIAAGGALGVLLPVGFSYRALENVAFLVDASRRQLPAFPRLVDYALFAAYFPKLLAGPIERGRAFLAQLPGGRTIDDEAFAKSATLVLVGLFRKLVLADGVRALMPGSLFTAPGEAAGLHVALWLLADVFVIYNDFAGYTGIARGVSALFGFDLSRNFDAPLLARNFSELWVRWHMSLSFWLRDYVYLPLSRALLRRDFRADGPANLLLPPLAAMLVSALWHGLAWNLLTWGATWALFLLLARLPALWGPVVPPDRWSRPRRALGILSVWLMLAASTALFRADVATALEILRSALAPARVSLPLLQALALMGISLALDVAQQRARDEFVFLRWPLWARCGALAAATVAIFLATRFEVPEPFVYQNF